MCKYAFGSRELVCHHTSCHLTTDWDWSTSEETALTSKSWRMERTWCFCQPTIRYLIDLTIKQIELWKSKLQYNGQLMQSIIDIENDMQSEHHVDIQVSSPSPWLRTVQPPCHRWVQAGPPTMFSALHRCPPHLTDAEAYSLWRKVGFHAISGDVWYPRVN